MRLTKSLIIIFVLSFFALQSSRAGILIEPYLGYSLGGSGDVTVGTSKYDLSYSTPTIGARLGYGMLGFMGGIDYSMQSFDIKSELGSTEFKDGVSKNQLGIFVGYELPILLRVWGTYYLSSKVEGDDAPATNQVFDNRDKFEDGGGYALGVGFTGFPFISVNLEYRTLEYDKYVSNNSTATNYNEKADLSELLLSVSLPLDL